MWQQAVKTQFNATLSVGLHTLTESMKHYRLKIIATAYSLTDICRLLAGHIASTFRAEPADVT